MAAQDRVRLEELTGEPFILLEEGLYSEPLAAFEQAGFTADIKYTIHDDYAIMTMVEAGLGISILAELVLRGMNTIRLSRLSMTLPLPCQGMNGINGFPWKR